MPKSLDERINDLTRSILDGAQSDVEKLLSEARQKEKDILKRGDKQAAQLRASILEKASVDADQLKEEKIAEITVKARVEAYDRREQLLENVFSEVRSRLSHLPSEPGYAQALQGLIREAATQLQSQTVVLLFDPASRQLVDEENLKQLGSELGIEIGVGEDLSESIGVVARDINSHRVFDNTLQSRLDRQMIKLRTSVFSILIGEKACPIQ